jgi:hypothetical protein
MSENIVAPARKEVRHLIGADDKIVAQWPVSGISTISGHRRVDLISVGRGETRTDCVRQS